MAEEQLQQFLEKVRQLNAFVALCEARPALRQELAACGSHGEVVRLAQAQGFEIGRRWGESQAPVGSGDANLLVGACPEEGQEHLRLLLEQPGLRLERIHSCAAASPEGFWYEQRDHEWLLLLQGSARIAYGDGRPEVALHRGDSLLIPAGCRHRVMETDDAPGTIWLALFWRQEG
jgi:cupin 2 domain-containing protein